VGSPAGGLELRRTPVGPAPDGDQALEGRGRVHDEVLVGQRTPLAPVELLEDELVVGGIETTMPLFQELIKQPDILDGDYNIHWLEHYLARRSTGAL